MFQANLYRSSNALFALCHTNFARRQKKLPWMMSKTNVFYVFKDLSQQPRGGNYQCNFIDSSVYLLAKSPVNRALKNLDEDRKLSEDISYKSLMLKGQQIAHFLKTKGVKKGDSVALMLGQCPNWWFAVAGCMKEGIAIVPCPRLLTPDDLLYRINDLKMKAIIVDSVTEEKINTIIPRLQQPLLKLTTGDAHDNWFSTKDIFSKTVSESLLSLEKSITTTQDPCVYLYTSGTTGNPKAVEHGHGYPFAHYNTGANWMMAKPGDIIYNASDTGWGFTLWTTLGAWSTGAQVLVTPSNKKFDASRMLDNLINQEVSILCAAPTVLRRLVVDPSFDDRVFSKLKRIVTVGEALDEVVIEKFKKKGVETHVGFGQAETPLIIGRLNNQSHIPGTMGKPVNPYRTVILDDDSQPVSPGNSGQIAVDLYQGASNGIFNCYFGDPKRTAKSFSADQRYYFTGDWAHLKEDGNICYMGRRDDLIKSHGYRIGPDEVEKAGMEHPAVAKIAVVAKPSVKDASDIVVKAFILLKPEYTGSPELTKSIQNCIKEKTAPYKYPREIEFFDLDEWQTYETISGKIKRAQLRQRELNQYGEHDQYVFFGQGSSRGNNDPAPNIPK